MRVWRGSLVFVKRATVPIRVAREPDAPLQSGVAATAVGSVSAPQRGHGGTSDLL